MSRTTPVVSQYPARANAFVLCRGNLHVINVVVVPDRLKARIGKAEDQHVLDRLFPQVVIHTVDLFFVDHLEQLTVERPCRGHIAAKGFSIMRRRQPPLSLSRSEAAASLWAISL